PPPSTVATGASGLADRVARGAGWVWVAGSVFTLGLACARIRRFRRVLGEAKPASECVNDLVAEIAARIGLARCPDVRTFPGEVAPMVWALARSPLLILPAGLWKRLDARQRQTLVAHELAHLKRGD